MNTFLVVFNTEHRSNAAIGFMNLIVQDEHTDFCRVLSALHLSVFLVRTHWEQDQLVGRLEEMNDDSIKYWVVEHMTDCVAGQLDQACRWANLPSGGDPLGHPSP